MNQYFHEIPRIYKESVEKISSYPSEEDEEKYIENSERFIDLLKSSKRVIWAGTGRQEEMADFATRITKANDKTTYCSKDSSIPYK